MLKVSQKAWNKIFNVELIIGIVWIVLFSFHPERSFPIYLPVINWVFLAILVVLLILSTVRKKNRHIQTTISVLSALALPFTFNKLIQGIVTSLNTIFASWAPFFSIVGCLALLLVSIPMVKASLPAVKNWILRLIVVEGLGLSQLAPALKFYCAPKYVSELLESGLINALAMFILAFFIFKAWGLKFEWNLKFIKTKNFQWWALVLLLLFSAYFPFFNVFLGIAQTPVQIFNWDFSTFEVTLTGFLSAVEAGIMEETQRCLDIVVLLFVFRNFKGKVVWATVISSLLFSLDHLTNLGSTQFGVLYHFTKVEQQMIYTFGFGMLAAVLYLYTGKLWLSMLVHFGLDFIVFSETPLTVSISPFFDNWACAFIVMAASSLVAIFMLLGKRCKFMDDNADRIMKM